MTNDSILTSLMDTGTVGKLCLLLGLVIGYNICVTIFACISTL